MYQEQDYHATSPRVPQENVAQAFGITGVERLNLQVVIWFKPSVCLGEILKFRQRCAARASIFKRAARVWVFFASDADMCFQVPYDDYESEEDTSEALKAQPLIMLWGASMCGVHCCF